MSHNDTQVFVDQGTSAGRGNQMSRRNARRSHKTLLVLQLAAMVGIAALVYPSAADWFAGFGHSAEVSGYVREVEQLPDETRLSQLRQAKDYNTHIPAGMLRDPYSAAEPQVADLAQDQEYQNYLNTLRVSDNQNENAVIGEVSYPELGIDLPIYHGTSDEVLRQGIGHLYGSSLPVGGPSTHSVMTSHSGLIHASLFTDLLKAQVGDVFTVSVLGETLYYEVRNLETVLPDQTEGLGVIEGEDWVTLVTCTPIGVNSHRMLVQAQRIESPQAAGTHVIGGAQDRFDFPWWALAFIAGSAGVGYLLFRPHKSATTDVNDEMNESTEARA